MRIIFVCLIVYLNFLFADNAETVRREGWQYNNTRTLETSEPTNLHFFKYYDSLPDEITLKIFNEQDLSHLTGKKLVVGYGIADKSGTDCKIFKAEDTGAEQDITVCLPWWRIEREYKKNMYDNAGGGVSFIKTLKKPKAPMMVNYCEEYADGKEYLGGIVACTSYFDRNAGGDCWDNPEQEACFVDNCGNEIKNRCEFIDVAIGVTEELPTAVLDEANRPSQVDTKVKLKSHRYECPAGPIVEDVECLREQTVVMFPYECQPDNATTIEDDGEYIYCDEDKPVFGAGGNISGFLGKCSDGSTVTCPVNHFQNTTKVCTEPIYDTESNSELQQAEMERAYTSHEVDVLSGEADIYSENDSCLRANTIDDARDQQITANIVGGGTLDDDIYILKHKTDGSHYKVYCNMQHASNIGNAKSYNGDLLQCIANDGHYSYNETITIDTTDILTVQQNSEAEEVSGVPFSIGRRHYNSSKVTIDGVEVAPRTIPADFPAYPVYEGENLATWDNVTATTSILFPFAGAYDLFFYNDDNIEVAKASINIDNFREISQNGALQLKLGKTMSLAPGMLEEEANRTDMWVEWGGGVYKGKNSITGEACAEPVDAYVKNRAVTKIIVKDLLTGAVVPIKLVYPAAYPNRFFVSKLKVYETRKYRCYNDFPDVNILGVTGDTKYACSTTSQWQNYINGFTDSPEGVQLWDTQNLCEQNCRENYTCSTKNELDVYGYTCTQRGGEDIGGDLGGNFFSDKTTCDSYCYTQNSCSAYANNNCEMVEEQLSNPVTDWTGKSLFKNKTVTYNCEHSTEKQIGCGAYRTEVTQGDFNYGVAGIEYESKDYSSKFEDAVTKAHMMEVGQQHIFSGWDGKCVQGMKWDFSYLSDPMTIVSYAMSAYSTMDYMGNEMGVDWAKNMTDKFDSFIDGIGNSVSDSLSLGNSGDVLKAGTESSGGLLTTEIAEVGGATSETLNTSITENFFNNNMSIDPSLTAQTNFANNLTNSVFPNLNVPSNMSVMEQLKTSAQEIMNDVIGSDVIDFDATVSIGGVDLSYGNYINITQEKLMIFGFKSAMALAAPSEQNYITANKILQGYAGINADDSIVHEYNACMASIGASLPSLVGWSVDSIENTSGQLLAPWKHPLRMTPEQLASIATVKGEDYVTSQYMFEDTGDILMNVIAISSQAYLEAAETICMGSKVSQAEEHIQSANNANASGGSALGIAKAGISMVCAPCGFAMTIALDLYNNVFTKIDTCNSEEDAIGWDMQNFKTYKFLGKEQCHYIQTKCDKKVSFMGCVRHRKEYCCYDQVTTRIFAEGLKAQMYAPDDDDMWASCSDISIDDLKNIAFRECNVGEIPHINKCIPTDIYTDFQKTLFRQASKSINTNINNGLVNQAINSMAIQKDNE